MTTSAVENLPAIWDCARDIPFLRITARLFTLEFCLGASVLLVSYDGGPVDVQLTPAQHRSSTTTPRGVDNHTRPERFTIPVRSAASADPPPPPAPGRSSRSNTIRTAPGQRR